MLQNSNAGGSIKMLHGTPLKGELGTPISAISQIDSREFVDGMN